MVYNRALAASCTNCANRDARISWSHGGRGAELGCTVCSHPLAGQLRLENYSVNNTKDILNNENALRVWHNLAQLQNTMLKGQAARTKRNTKYQFTEWALDLANLLTTSVDDTVENHCILDSFFSPYFPSFPSRQSKSRMIYPYPAMDLANRRKALGLVSALLGNNPQLFTGEGVINVNFAKDLSLINIRPLMSNRQISSLDEILMRLPSFHARVLSGR